MADTTPWGSDSPVSLPAPLRPDEVAYVDMGGFAFTEFGIAHNFRESDWEHYLPHFAPRNGAE